MRHSLSPHVLESNITFELLFFIKFLSNLIRSHCLYPQWDSDAMKDSEFFLSWGVKKRGPLEFENFHSVGIPLQNWELKDLYTLKTSLFSQFLFVVTIS